MSIIKPQVALVTGAAQGLGLVIARGLLAAGYNVAITDSNFAAAKVTAKTLMGSLDVDADRVLALDLDVLSKTAFEKALAAVVDKFGGCDVLVNNAAMTPTTAILDISPEEFDQVININLRGTFFGCQVFGRYFSEQNYGRIINLASLAGQAGGAAAGAHYAASKGGILTLTKVFARQFAAQKVTVNAVAPGPVDVPSIRDKVPAERLAEIIETGIPVKALSNPEFIAAMVVMMASTDANTVTGTCWDANGGMNMR